MLLYVTVVHIIFIVFCSCNYNVNENSVLVIDVISSIISEFEEYDIIFHYDNSTRYKVDLIIKTVNVTGALLMQNYQLSVQLRPVGFKFLHVILLDNYTHFKEFTQLSTSSLSYVDILFFTVNSVNETNKFQYWPRHRLDTAGSMFILNSNNWNLYSVCFYCGRKSKYLQKIAIVSDNITNNFNISVSLLNIHRNQFTNFNGFVFNVAYGIYKPFFWGRIIQIGNATFVQMRGSEAELIYTLHQKLNMRFYMEQFNETEENWNKLVEVVANDSFDFAMGGITLTNKRMQTVDFTHPIHSESYTVLYSLYEDPWMSWLNIIVPFDLYVWMTLILFLIGISVLLDVAVKITRIKRNNMNFIYFFGKCIRLLSEQSVPRIQSVMTSRLVTLWLMISWLLLALIMTNSYKSKLTSFLITSKADEYDSIDELVAKKYNYLMNTEDSYVIQEYLENSADPKYLETLKRSKHDTDFCESILRTSQGKIAVIDEETYFQYGIDRYCSDITSSDVFSNLRLIRKPLYPSSHAWPMQKNAPFRDSINRIIAQLHSGGLFLHWSNKYGKIETPIRKSKQHQQSANLRRFSMINMAGPIFIWFLGIIFATLMFIIEFIKYKCTNNYIK